MGVVSKVMLLMQTSREVFNNNALIDVTINFFENYTVTAIFVEVKSEYFQL
jgi:hypothetical protein